MAGESITTISWYKAHSLTHQTAAMHSEASSSEVSRLRRAWVPLTEECCPEWNLPAAHLLSGIWRDLQSTSQPLCLLYLPGHNTTTQINSRTSVKTTLYSDTYHANINSQWRSDWKLISTVIWWIWWTQLNPNILELVGSGSMEGSSWIQLCFHTWKNTSDDSCLSTFNY